MHIQTSQQEKLNLGIGDYSCNWGLHIAGLYETPQERDEIIFGLLKPMIKIQKFQLNHIVCIFLLIYLILIKNLNLIKLQ